MDQAAKDQVMDQAAKDQVMGQAAKDQVMGQAAKDQVMGQVITWPIYNVWKDKALKYINLNKTLVCARVFFVKL